MLKTYLSGTYIEADKFAKYLDLPLEKLLLLGATVLLDTESDETAEKSNSVTETFWHKYDNRYRRNVCDRNACQLWPIPHIHYDWIMKLLFNNLTSNYSRP